MRDIKTEFGLGGDHNWPQIPTALVEGDVAATPWQKAGEEAIIQSWERIAVLEVVVDDRVPLHTRGFYLSFSSGQTSKVLLHLFKFSEHENKKQVGVRVGDGDVVWKLQLDTPTRYPYYALRVVTVTGITDPDYDDLELI